MLSAFTARPIVELKARDKSKVESVLTYGKIVHEELGRTADLTGDRLLVGLSTGSLRVYRVNEGSNAAEKPVELLREEEKFSKYKIEQLALIKEAATLISLSNGLVSTHDQSTYQLHDTLLNTKGATTFAVTSNIVNDQGIPLIVSRLAVAVKRRLLLWTWQDSDLISEAKEITLVTGIKSLTWASATRLVAGLTSSFVLIDVETENVIDIVGPGSIGGGSTQDVGRFSGAGVASLGYMGMGGMVPRPLASRLKDGEILLAKDVNTHFIDTDGKALGRRQIPWAVAPEAIGYSYPFLLSLNSAKGTLEVRNPETLTQLQSISLPNANQFHVPNPNVSLAHAGKGFLIASERCIWRMDALGYDDQIDALTEKCRYDEAISLLEMLEDALLKNKEGRLREIKLLKAQELFNLRSYRESMALFTKARAPPERVISLYPSAISGNLYKSHEVTQATEKTLTDSDHTNEPDASEDGRPRSSQERKDTTKDQSAGRTPQGKTGGHSTEISDAASQRSVPVSEAIHQRRELDGKELRTATLELNSFLVDARTLLKRFLNDNGTMKEEDFMTSGESEEQVNVEDILVPREAGTNTSLYKRLLETAELVDTALFRGYMLAAPSLAGSLFRLPNFCDPLVVKEKLQQSKRYNDLIDFLYGKRMHREALDLLRSIAISKEDEECPEMLKGPQRTVLYLQNLSPEYFDLILEYVRWPLEEDSKLAMEVFVTDSENAETLPRDRVLSFLKEVGKPLATQYLEHIIYELDDASPDLHRELIEEYLWQLKAASGEDKDRLQQKLLSFLKGSRHYQSWKILPLLERHGMMRPCLSGTQDT